MRITTARPTFVWRNWLAWLPTALLIALALSVGGRVPPASALPLGIVVLDPWPLALALLAALLALLILRLVLNPVFDLMGIELRLPDEAALDAHG